MSVAQPQTPTKTTGSCYRCNKIGHWAKDCPQSPSNRSPISMPSSTPDYPPTHCRCGAGFCEIRVSHSTGNPDRAYYCCPGKCEMHCGYFKWCDKMKREEIIEVQPIPFPICGCGAGVCNVKTEESEPNVNRTYFVCHIKKGDGACPYRQWVDKYLEENQEFDLSPEEEIQFDAVVECALEFSSEEDQDQVLPEK